MPPRSLYEMMVVSSPFFMRGGDATGFTRPDELAAPDGAGSAWVTPPPLLPWPNPKNAPAPGRDGEHRSRSVALPPPPRAPARFFESQTRSTRARGALLHRKHSHFFTAKGKFGSRDWNGKQVDDGTYRLVNDHTFVLNGSLTFYFRIQGDTIAFDPVIPARCSSKQCRENHAYAVLVALPGDKWKRVA
jgi:hypothetical protein